MTVRSPEVHNGITNDDLDGLQPPCAASVKSLSLLPDWANVNKDVAITDFVYFGCNAVIYLGGTNQTPTALP